MFSFFNKSKNQPEGFSFLGTDMHSHLIYEIDDGSRSASESLDLISNLQRLGFEKFITTPHIFMDYYPNMPETINNGLVKLKADLEKANETVDIFAAAEYYGDEHLLELLDQDQQLLTISDNYVLFEVSMLAESPLLPEILFQLKTKGYQPILAHPERYLYKKGDTAFFNSLDCSLQVNLLSLAGYYGPEQKKFGIELINAGMVDFIGTDIHHTSQISYLDKLTKNRKVMKMLKDRPFKNAQL